MRPPLYDMRPQSIIFFHLLIFFFSFPLSAQAFWGDEQDSRPSLNLESGYDVNTVTTVTGQIVSIQAGTQRHNFLLAIEGGGTRMMVVLGPQWYWVDHGVPLKEGDEVVVHGSMAQGQDGVLYILAQQIMETRQGVIVFLRDESGHPNWGGGGMRRGNGTGGGEGGSGNRGRNRGGGGGGW